jgi:hypothetical protein
LSLSFSTDRARLSLLSSLRSDDYREPVSNAYAGGKLSADHGIKGEVDVTDELRGFIMYRSRSGADSIRSTATSELSSSTGLQWSRPDYPSIIARGEYMDVHDHLGTRTRRGGRIDAAWTPSTTLLSRSGISAARFSGYARISEETASGVVHDGRYRSSNYFFRSVINPRQLFSANLWYQGDMREKRTLDGRFNSEYQTEKINLDLLMEHITGISLGGRLTREIRQLPAAASIVDQSSSAYILTNARITPGTWLPVLQPFILYASFSHTLDEYHSGGEQAAAFGLSLLSAAGGRRQRASSSIVYDARLEWRPLYGVLYSIRGLWQQSRSEQLSSSNEHAFWIMTHNAEWRPDNRSVYAARFQFRKTNYVHEQRQDLDPGVWVEQRFSRVFLGRLALYATLLRNESMAAIRNSQEVRPAITLTLTIDKAPILGRTEIRMDAGYTHFRSVTTRWTGQRTAFTSERLYNTVYLDMYPHPVLFLRLRSFFTWLRDDTRPVSLFAPEGWIQPDVELQLVMQL